MGKQFQERITDVMLKKHEGWRYENEERIVLPGKARQYLMFNSCAITGIIFGCKSMRREKEAVLEIIKERESTGKSPVNIYQAIQNKCQYRLGIYSYESL